MSGTITNTNRMPPVTRSKFSFTWVLLGVIAWMAGPQQEASAAEFTVGTVGALIQAIKDANANTGADVIKLNAGVYTLTDIASERIDVLTYTDPNGVVTTFDDAVYGANGLPLIESDITLQASPGSVIIERSGSKVFRFFHVRPGAALRLEGVVLRNGRADQGRSLGFTGGAILNQGVTVIHDSSFENNIGGKEGGAINNRPGARLEVHNSTFTANTLSLWNSLGGAIINVGGEMTIDHSTFKGNSTCISCRDDQAGWSEDGDGGAIENVAGEATITNSTFIENQSVSGGAVENGRGLITIVNSSFYQNRATKWGGAISAYAENSPTPERNSKKWGDGVIVIINSTIVGNHAGDAGIDKPSPSTFGGGGVLTQKGAIILKNTILAGNTAPAGMPQECTGYPYFHDNPVYIISAGHNIIDDTAGCLTVPEEMPQDGSHTHGGEPLLVTLETGARTDMTGDAGVGAFSDSAVPGHGHLPLLPSSAAVNAADNDTSISVSAQCMGAAPLMASGLSTDQLGNGVGLAVRDIGAVEYTGSVSPAPATLLPLTLAVFDPSAVCEFKEQLAVDGGGAGAGGGNGGDVPNNEASNSNGGDVQDATGSAQGGDAVPVGESTNGSTSAGGGGAWGLWSLLLGMLAIGLKSRRRCACAA